MCAVEHCLPTLHPAPATASQSCAGCPLVSTAACCLIAASRHAPWSGASITREVLGSIDKRARLALPAVTGRKGGGAGRAGWRCLGCCRLHQLLPLACAASRTAAAAAAATAAAVAATAATSSSSSSSSSGGGGGGGNGGGTASTAAAATTAATTANAATAAAAAAAAT